MEGFSLRRGGAVALIAPALGGAILAFEIDGVPVLRPAPPNAAHPFESAHFVLAPHANRIAGGRFDFAGKQVSLSANSNVSRHPLHGQAWLSAWAVEQKNESVARLVQHHAPDAWPWAYSLRQTVTVTEDGLAIDLALRNESTTPMPAGLGFHPYFPRARGMMLTAQTEGVWAADEEMLPTQYILPGPHDWAGGVRLDDLPELVDHCHAPWRSSASLADATGATIIAASDNCSRLHILVPQGGNFVCIEPVTHRPSPFPDFVRHGMVALAPGETLQADMTLRRQPAHVLLATSTERRSYAQQT